MDITQLICCSDSELACYVKPCNSETRKPLDYFIATAFVEGLTVPVKGDTIIINSTPIELTAKNYGLKLLEWMRNIQYKCGIDNSVRGINGTITKGRVTFFDYNSIKGTRPKSTKKQGNALFDGTIPRAVGITAKTMYSLADSWANQSWLNGMLFERKKISIINFTDTALEVLRPEDGYTIVVTDGGLEWKGDNKQVEGAMEVEHEGKKDYVLDLIEESDFVTYQAELKRQTMFNFSRDLIVVTGLTPLVCGKFSECIQYETTTTTPFDFIWDKLESSTCTEWKLFKNCTEDVKPLPILIDTNTGKVTSTGLLNAGEYKFTVTVENECCVYGSYCINITVK